MQPRTNLDQEPRKQRRAAHRELRVLEVSSGIPAAYAAWLLSRTGVDVLRLEMPAIQGRPPESERNFAAFDRLFGHLDSGKKTVPVHAQGGAPLLTELLKSVEMVLADSPGQIQAWFGCSPAQLAARHPQLIVAVATVFGLEGPYAQFPGVALDAQAVSGIAWAIGSPQRSPLSLPANVVQCQAGAHLAGAALLALEHSMRTGLGQLVDVSLTDVLAYYASCNSLNYLSHGLQWHRAGRQASGSSGPYPYVILPCKDGSVCLIGRSKAEWERFVEAMGHPEWTRNPRYQDLRAMGCEYSEEVDALVMPWLARHTRVELAEISLKHSLPMAALRDFTEVLGTPQFAARRFFERVSFGQASLQAPGLPFKIKRSQEDESKALDFKAGGATVDVRSLIGPRHHEVAEAISDTTGHRPLAGMRVLDLGWVWSAPMAAGILTEFGAEVIKVEHSGRLDGSRLRGRPLKDGKPVEGPSIELAPQFHQTNHGKLGITLNLKDPRAIALLKRLVTASDIVIENMSPGSLARAGLGYDVLKAINPRLIVVSMSAAGQTGPDADMRAYAPVMSSFVGLEGQIGYPGELPIGAMNVGLGDTNAAIHALVALLGALNRRHETGRGCYIDLSQIEALACTLGVQIMDAAAGEPSTMPRGNRHPSMAPHGIYPAAGADSWLTLCVTDDDAWLRLCALAKSQAWARNPAYASAAQRLVQTDELDSAIAAWTGSQDRDELSARLRASGIASSPVLSVQDQGVDPHVSARGLRRSTFHPHSGPEDLLVAPWHFSAFRAEIDRSSPTLGQDNEKIFCELLGLPMAEYDELIAAAVIA